MAADEFRATVDDDVGPVLEGTAEHRAGEGVVDDDRQAGIVGDLADGLEVGDIDAGVADRLHVEGAGVGVDRLFEVVGIALVDELGGDAVLGQRVVEQVVRSAVEAGGRDDVLAGGGDVHHRQRFRRLTGRHGQRSRTPFESGDPLFEHIARGVHQPRVDVAELLQAEQAGGVVTVVEDVRSRLINGNRAGVGGGVGGLTGVEAAGGEMGGRVGHDSAFGENRQENPRSDARNVLSTRTGQFWCGNRSGWKQRDGSTPILSTPVLRKTTYGGGRCTSNAPRGAGE